MGKGMRVKEVRGEQVRVPRAFRWKEGGVARERFAKLDPMPNGFCYVARLHTGGVVVRGLNFLNSNFPTSEN